MANATAARSRRKAKPDKPYADYPPFFHASGRIAKTIRGRLHYFGRWGSKDGNRIVPVEDVPAAAAEALAEFNRQWTYLQRGETPPVIGGDDGPTIREVCNEFYAHKQARLRSGELSTYLFDAYVRICQQLCDHFGRDRPVSDLRPADFESLRAELAKGCNATTLAHRIHLARIVFKFAYDAELIDRPVRYGVSFSRPSKRAQTTARQENGKPLFTVNELRRMLNTARQPLRAMILLGINCGFGNHDIAALPQSALELENGWVEFPRPKTGVERRCPLWPETVAAVRAATRCTAPGR